MSDGINNNIQNQLPNTHSDTSVSKRRNQITPTEGNITKLIGAGDNAKNSIVWMTIRWIIWTGAGLSVAVSINSFFTCTNASLSNEIVTIWQLLIPVLTLALGYLFGKSGK